MCGHADDTLATRTVHVPHTILAVLAVLTLLCLPPGGPERLAGSLRCAAGGVRAWRAQGAQPPAVDAGYPRAGAHLHAERDGDLGSRPRLRPGEVRIWQAGLRLWYPPTPRPAWRRRGRRRRLWVAPAKGPPPRPHPGVGVAGEVLLRRLSGQQALAPAASSIAAHLVRERRHSLPGVEPRRRPRCRARRRASRRPRCRPRRRRRRRRFRQDAPVYARQQPTARGAAPPPPPPGCDDCGCQGRGRRGPD